MLLRPLTEDDWAPLLTWNNDPQVLEFAEGDDVQSRTLDEVQRIWRSISVNAHCFLMERDGAPIGECWLQRMNLQRLAARHPGEDVRRIDIAIGVPALWGQGLGREAVALLLDFGFRREGVDVIYACVDAENSAAGACSNRSGSRSPRALTTPPGLAPTPSTTWRSRGPTTARLAELSSFPTRRHLASGRSDGEDRTGKRPPTAAGPSAS